MVRVISRLTEQGVKIFDEYLELIDTIVVPQDPPPQTYTVSSTGDRLVYTTSEAAICLGPDRREAWRFEFPPGTEVVPVDCAFCHDDTLVWLFLPNVARGSSDPDVWTALDAVTGEIKVCHDLETSGLGGHQIAFPYGTHMMLDVSEGEAGSRTFDSGGEDWLRTYPWNDRCAIAIAPDASGFMTVAHGQEDVAFHSFGPEDERVTVTISDFPVDPDRTVIEWAGGFLDGDAAIVVLSDEESWWRHFRVDTRFGEVIGDLGIETIDEYDLELLGDGTYVITDTDGTLRRM
ncbi:hypothetical protein AMIS_4790 [Actinoplanes missouriensis 431]|uniref:WD40 repeat domain-containing protein n=1 Tax=Actinoplanes missouriensis (strain ATCC 14538 / DSM 43046 / CBS 188.64 / JCM 3121 / NBRC 102363 / NCIMB 12654 / NRRL B-3342 / UNCC 431) TaxID=512565 RepID=I0GY62_ACTM4|nr:hypothetical protein AMIS_4790 [Actinoplanes missouriensis 431]